MFTATRTILSRRKGAVVPFERRAAAVLAACAAIFPGAAPAVAAEQPGNGRYPIRGEAVPTRFLPARTAMNVHSPHSHASQTATPAGRETDVSGEAADSPAPEDTAGVPFRI